MDGTVPSNDENINESEDDAEEKNNGSDDDEKAHHCPQPMANKTQSILDLLFSMLTDTPSMKLDDRRAGYLEKILIVLFRRKPLSMAAYVNGDHLVNQIITGMSHCTIKEKTKLDLEFNNIRF